MKLRFAAPVPSPNEALAQRFEPRLAPEPKPANGRLSDHPWPRPCDECGAAQPLAAAPDALCTECGGKVHQPS